MPWITAAAAVAVGCIALAGARGYLAKRPRALWALAWMSLAMGVMAAAMLWPARVRALPEGVPVIAFLAPFGLGLYFSATPTGRPSPFGERGLGR